MKKIIKTALAIALIFSARADAVWAKDMVQVRGSDTMVNMAQRLSEVFMSRSRGSSVAVTGGGSGGGIAALINKTVDIANASRDMKENEFANAIKNKVDVKKVVIALDCVTVIVNPSNAVEKLTLGQLGMIYRGEATNWRDFGGDNTPITLYGRQSNSGTFSFFRDMVVKADYSSRMMRMNGNSQIVEAVKSDKGAIGYVGLGHAKKGQGIKTVKLANTAGSHYADPMNPADIDSGKYPLLRTLNQYINGQPKGQVRDFLAFELSPEGQKIVEESGFVGVPEEYVEANRKSAGI